MSRNLTFGALAAILVFGLTATFAQRSTAPEIGSAFASSSSSNGAAGISSPPDVEVAGARTRVFTINPGMAQARFVIDEVLRGSPNTVVGVTDQVTGQFTVNPMQPASAQLGPILVNVRTLATDDNLRNNAIRRFILETDQHEYVTFTPTGVVGLPNSAELGQSYSLQVPGQLTIRNMTRDVVFDTSVTPVSEAELRGTASTTIRYGDWNISIPQIPFVAGVGENVRLELDFQAI